MRFNWTDEAVAALRDMVEQRMPYGDIAMTLSQRFTPVDADAVSGKVYRLGIAPGTYVRLPGSTSGERTVPAEPPPDGFRYAFKGASGQRAMTDLVPILQVVDVAGGVGLLELRSCHCRWPLWADNARPREPRYCGAIIDPVETYCPAHARRAYDERAPRPKTSDATRQAQRIGQLRRWHKTGAAS